MAEDSSWVIARRVRDLSRSKQAEEQLRRKQAALELAHEAAGLGTWEYELDPGTMYWDERAKALFGLPDDAPVTVTAWLEAIHPEDRAADRGALEPGSPGALIVLGGVPGSLAG